MAKSLKFDLHTFLCSLRSILGKCKRFQRFFFQLVYTYLFDIAALERVGGAE